MLSVGRVLCWSLSVVTPVPDDYCVYTRAIKCSQAQFLHKHICLRCRTRVYTAGYIKKTLQGPYKTWKWKFGDLASSLWLCYKITVAFCKASLFIFLFCYDWFCVLGRAHYFCRLESWVIGTGKTSLDDRAVQPGFCMPPLGVSVTTWYKSPQAPLESMELLFPLRVPVYSLYSFFIFP